MHGEEVELTAERRAEIEQVIEGFGEDALRTYRCGTGTARHLFCETCGVKSFYVPRSHPDGYSVNARSLDPGSIRALRIEPFDGAHWERSAAGLEPLEPRAGDEEA